MRIMKLVGIIMIILFIPTGFYAQTTVKVKKAQGQWVVSEEVTLKQAEERALQEAKKDALQKAGIMESVWSVFGQITQDNGEEFHEAYSQMSVLAIGGMVRVTDQKVEDIWVPEEKRLYKVVTIDATVKKEEKADIEYALEVKGVERIYKAGEFLSFNLKIHGSNSYVKFFWFDEKEGSLIYPNDYEKSILFERDQVYNFPMSKMINYQMTKNSPSAVSEKVNIMIVATKSDVPYIGSVTYPQVLEWIYSIPANQRCTFYEMTLIK